MKITSIDTAVLTVPTPKPMALQYPHHKLVVATLATDEGIRGLGYSPAFNGRGAEIRRPRLQVLQDEDPSPRPGGEREPRRGGEEGAGARRAHDGRRQPEPRCPRQRAAGEAAGGVRPPLVRGAGARRRLRWL